jgi:3'-5' exoribonuclease
MERQYAADLKPGARVDAAFALTAKEVRAARTGEAYLVLEFTDRSGRIPGIMFRPRRDAESIPVGLVTRVRGVVTEYRGVTRISVESMQPAVSYDPSDMLPRGARDEDELLGHLRGLVRRVAHPGLAALLRVVFGDAGLMSRFKTCPASPGGHHAYLGGLLEHTVSVGQACRQLSSMRPELDSDLLLAGALLHDVGVVDEVSYETGITQSDEGRLVGHVVLGERRVRQAIMQLGDRVSPETGTLLSHLVLSHHGDDLQGAMPPPATLEAIALRHADRMDAETAGFVEITKRASQVGESWTDADNAFGCSLRVPASGPQVREVTDPARSIRRSA